MKLLITGASGYLGSSLFSDLQREHDVIGTYGNNQVPGLLPLQVTDRDDVFRVLRHERPDAVIHCASTAKGEFDRDQSSDALDRLVRVNVEGTQNMMKGAGEIGAPFVYISSPTVFEGREGPFTEEDAMGTDDKYGQTRIAAEEIVRDSGLSHVIIRPSMIVGVSPRGMDRKFFGKVAHAIKTNTSADLDGEWRFAPSWNHHIASVIDWWISQKNKDEVHLLHVVTPEITTQLELAQKICVQLGVDHSLFQKKEPPWDGANNILDGSKLKMVQAPTVGLDEVVSHIARELQNPTTPEGNPPYFKR